MLSLMNHVISICVPPLMLRLHLWLTLSFLLFPDAPPAPMHIPRLTLLSSMSSSESAPVVPDYKVKPPMTQFYSRRGAQLSNAPPSLNELSSDV
jgi:hypothetical protein